MRVYIAGPMTAYRDSNYNFPEFYKAQALLEMIGYTVHNPARMDIESGKAQFAPFEGRIVTAPDFTLADAMRRDIKVIADCEAIVLLPDWQNSKGAAMELQVARDFFQMPVFEMSVSVSGWPILTRLE